MQGRTVILLVTFTMLSSGAVARTAAPVPNPKPVPIAGKSVAEKPVDENGVPAWARRKRMYPVQSCETKPNIGVETWRQKYDSSAPQRLKIRTPTSTCH